jgi:hypothetical protein
LVTLADVISDLLVPLIALITTYAYFHGRAQEQERHPITRVLPKRYHRTPHILRHTLVTTVLDASNASSACWNSSSDDGSGRWTPMDSSRRRLCERSIFRRTWATIVFSHPPRFCTSLAPDRLRRSQVS